MDRWIIVIVISLFIGIGIGVLLPRESGPQGPQIAPKQSVLALFSNNYVMRSYQFEITAYTSSKEECGKWYDGYTAAMIRVNDLKWGPLGIVAVDPETIPLGSLVFIPGRGLHLACDTGKKIKGMMIDILMEDKRKARLWGRQQMEVLIIQERGIK